MTASKPYMSQPISSSVPAILVTKVIIPTGENTTDIIDLLGQTLCSVVIPAGTGSTSFTIDTADVLPDTNTWSDPVPLTDGPGIYVTAGSPYVLTFTEATGGEVSPLGGVAAGVRGVIISLENNVSGDTIILVKSRRWA